MLKQMILGKKVILALGFVLILLVGWLRFELDTDILHALPQNSEQVQGLKTIRDRFAGADDLLIGLEFQDEARAIQGVQAIQQALTSHPDVGRVQSEESFFQVEQASALLAWVLQNSEPEKLTQIMAPLRQDQLPQYLQEVLERLSDEIDPGQVQQMAYDPLGWLGVLEVGDLASMQDAGFRLSSEDGLFRLLLVSPQQEFAGYKDAILWIERLREVVEPIATEFQGTLYFTGEPAFMAETGGGMERDMSGTIGLTLALIALLFWLVFRKIRWLLHIQLLLLLIMLLSVSVASAVLGTLSILSVGFAAIVIGIVVDYAVLILQKAHEHPEDDVKTLRRRSMPSLLAGALTTALVFSSLALMEMPGLADLGKMVAIGILIGFGVMWGLMPRLCAQKVQVSAFTSWPKMQSGWVTVLTVGFVLFLVLVPVFKGWPQFKSGPEALRPLHSEALSGWEKVQSQMGYTDRASVMILTEASASTLREQGKLLKDRLQALKSVGEVRGYSVPTALLPNQDNQQQNRHWIEFCLQDEARIKSQILEAGFTEDAWKLSEAVLQQWRRALEHTWPQTWQSVQANEVLQRVLADVAEEDTQYMLASVQIEGNPGSADTLALSKVESALEDLPHSRLIGWEILGKNLSQTVRADVMKVLGPLCLLLILALWLTFRSVIDTLLSIVCMAMSYVALMNSLTLLGKDLNLASLVAIPLMLGAGIDYSIHLLMAQKADVSAVTRWQFTIGRAVLFAGLSTCIGFGSLAFAGNAGLANMGLACGVGILWNLAIVLVFLPYWRYAMSRIFECDRRSKS